MFRAAPLSSGFFLVSIIGFFVSVFAIYPSTPTWGFTLLLFFMMMFISAIISMTYSNVDASMLKEGKQKKGGK